VVTGFLGTPVFEYGSADRERWVDEPPKNPRRTEFQRDRARVLHSSGLRRLGAKTQVVSPSSDDFVRTRLTHSLEVAQVGRELARYLGCDPEIVDTACLSHDLGHPPFGHNGENVLDALASDIGGFEGNAQTLRVITRLEPKVVTDDGGPAGLNLTRATLDACTKYPWPRSDAPAGRAGARVRKFGVYEDDREVFDFFRNGHPHAQRCLEAQIMDLADDISYSVHDVEDAIVAGHLRLEEFADDDAMVGLIDITRAWYLPEARDEDIVRALDRLRAAAYWPRDVYTGSRRDQASLKHMTSQLIGRFAAAAEAATREEFGWGPLGRYAGSLVVPDASVQEIAVLKGLATVTVMVAEDRLRLQEIQADVLRTVSEYFDERPEAMDPLYTADHRDAETDAQRRRAVIDQVASLTDHSAWTHYHRLRAGRADLL